MNRLTTGTYLVVNSFLLRCKWYHDWMISLGSDSISLMDIFIPKWSNVKLKPTQVLIIHVVHHLGDYNKPVTFSCRSIENYSEIILMTPWDVRWDTRPEFNSLNASLLTSSLFLLNRIARLQVWRYLITDSCISIKFLYSRGWGFLMEISWRELWMSGAIWTQPLLIDLYFEKISFSTATTPKYNIKYQNTESYLRILKFFINNGQPFGPQCQEKEFLLYMQLKTDEYAYTSALVHQELSLLTWSWTEWVTS